MVCLATPTWEGDYNKSTVQLISLIADTHQVLYVDYPYTLKDVASGLFKDQRIPVRRILGLVRRLRKMEVSSQSYLFVYTPLPTLPINWVPLPFLYRWLLKINNWIVMQGVRRAMRALNFAHPVVINALNPFYGLHFMHKLSPRKVIYYCYDEISAAPWLSKHGANAEQRFVAQADAIITSSATLYQKKLAYGRPCILVENGVSFRMFHQHFDAPSDAPPVVGYVGSLDDRIDYALLEFVIRQSPHLRFRFIGRITAVASVNALRKYSNVEFMPPVAYVEVPDQVSRLAVGLIPFVKDEFTRFIYPLKVNEYLAVGKPVVMTNFTQLEEFAEVAWICNDRETFLGGIHQALVNNDSNLRAKRAQVAQQNSWEHRTQKFIKVLSD